MRLNQYSDYGEGREGYSSSQSLFLIIRLLLRQSLYIQHLWSVLTTKKLVVFADIP